MALEEIKQRTIELLARNEEVISEVYMHFARKDISRYSFWSALAQEELLHAGWIRKLAASVAAGTVSFDENRFRIDMIEESIQAMKDQLAGFRQTPPSPKAALLAAQEIEAKLIEKEFFKAYATDDPLLQSLLTALMQATIEHANRLRETLQTGGIL